MGKGERNEEGGAWRFGEEDRRNQPAGRMENLGKAGEGSEGCRPAEGPPAEGGQGGGCQRSLARLSRSGVGAAVGLAGAGARPGEEGGVRGAPEGALARGVVATVHVGS